MSFDDPDDPPEGWVRFEMIRNTEKPDEVICFGFFDGTVEQLRASASASGYQEQLTAISNPTSSPSAPMASTRSSRSTSWRRVPRRSDISRRFA